MAKKAKPAVVKEDTAPKRSPEEVFSEHYPLMLQAKIEAEAKGDEKRKADAVFRTALKAFKKAGGNTRAMTDALQARKEDPDEVTLRLRDFERYRRWMNLPLGAQGGLFEGEEEKIAAWKPAATTLTHATDLGRVASEKGLAESDNPFDDGSPQFLAWRHGHQEDQKQRVLAMGRKPVHVEQPQASA